jgi:hypothetical protein
VGLLHLCAPAAVAASGSWSTWPCVGRPATGERDPLGRRLLWPVLSGLLAAGLCPGCEPLTTGPGEAADRATSRSRGATAGGTGYEREARSKGRPGCWARWEWARAANLYRRAGDDFNAGGCTTGQMWQEALECYERVALHGGRLLCAAAQLSVRSLYEQAGVGRAVRTLEGGQRPAANSTAAPACSSRPGPSASRGWLHAAEISTRPSGPARAATPLKAGSFLQATAAGVRGPGRRLEPTPRSAGRWMPLGLPGGWAPAASGRAAGLTAPAERRVEDEHLTWSRG